MEKRIINSITNSVTKSLDNKLKVILSTLKEVSGIMGIEVPIKDDVFTTDSSKVIEGHAKAFKDVSV